MEEPDPVRLCVAEGELDRGAEGQPVAVEELVEDALGELAPQETPRGLGRPGVDGDQPTRPRGQAREAQELPGKPLVGAVHDHDGGDGGGIDLGEVAVVLVLVDPRPQVVVEVPVLGFVAQVSSRESSLDPTTGT